MSECVFLATFGKHQLFIQDNFGTRMVYFHVQIQIERESDLDRRERNQKYPPCDRIKH